MVQATKNRFAFPSFAVPSALMLALSLLTAACGSESMPDCAANPSDPACAPPDNACSTTSQIKLVANQVTMPSGNNHYTYDVDGNGTAENKVEDVVEGLEMTGLDIQNAFNSHLAEGDALVLIDIQGGSLMNGCANVVLRSAKPPGMPPAFNGNDTLTPDPDSATVKLVGNISNGQLMTTAPKNQPPASLGVLKLAVPITLGYKLPLTLYGARIEGQLVPTGITGGRLHGVLKKSDIEQYSFPVVAQAVTQRINEPPNGQEESLMIGIFENQNNPISAAKCANTPAKCCATNPTTCVITPEEVGSSPLIQQIIAPDVQMFNGGNWSPMPGGGSPESLSFGIAFAAVKAKF